jgi:hypothetical protein
MQFSNWLSHFQTRLTSRPRNGRRPRRGHNPQPLTTGSWSIGQSAELLEDRSLLSAISIEQVAAELNEVTISSATIITHGFQLTEDGNSLIELAKAIRNRADVENGAGKEAWLLDYDLQGLFEVAAFDADQSVRPAASGLTGDVVILFDWARESNEDSSGWGEAAGDALFSLIVTLGLADPGSGTSVPFHFIGHSFGAAVTSEAVERLARFDIPVSQVTYLDPHDFNQASLPVDGDQRLFELGRPDGYGATVWDNVQFADVYYQTRGMNDGSGAPDLAVPLGRPIPGAYNYYIDGPMLPEDEIFGPYPFLYFSGDHSWIWDGFYRGTVNGTWPEELPQPEDPESINLTATGYAFSSLARSASGGFPDLSAAENASFRFRAHSSAVIADNGVTLSDNDLNFARFAPEWDPYSIVNGSFSHSGSPFPLSVPGWVNHGGGGDVTLGLAGVVNPGRLELNSLRASRTHNSFYIPSGAASIKFTMQPQKISTGDRLEVRLGQTVLRSLSLANSSTDLVAVPIPVGMRNTVQTLTFEIVAEGNVDATVQIDNVALSTEAVSTAGEPAAIEITSTQFMYQLHERIELKGRVVDQNGVPVSGQDVFAEDWLTSSTRVAGRTGADGSFTLTYSPDDVTQAGIYPLTLFVSRQLTSPVYRIVTLSVTDPSLMSVAVPGLQLNVGAFSSADEINQQTLLVSPVDTAQLPQAGDSSLQAFVRDTATVLGGALRDTLDGVTVNAGYGDRLLVGFTVASCLGTFAFPGLAAACVVGGRQLASSLAFSFAQNVAKNTVAQELQRGNLTAQEADLHNLFLDAAALGASVMQLRPGKGFGDVVNWVPELADRISLVEDSIQLGRDAGGFIRTFQAVGRDQATGDYYQITMQTRSDQQGNSAADAERVSALQSIQGVIEVPQDEDWYRVPLVAGRQYRFETILNGLGDSQLELFDRNGTTLLLSDDNSGSGNASRINFTPTQSGEYFLAIKGTGANAGGYGLEIDETIVNSEPEVEVRDESGRVLVDGAALLTFPSAPQGSAAPVRTLTVVNRGSSTLTLAPLSVPSGYTVVDQIASSLTPGSSDVVQIRLSTSSAGTFGGDANFTSNDSDESPFNLTLSGNVTAVSGSNAPIVGSLTLSPDSVQFNSAVTARAQVTDPDGDLAQVVFYQDLSGNGVVDAGDPVLGRIVPTSGGVATTTFYAHFGGGNHTILAVGIDDEGQIGIPRSATLNIVDTRPTDPVIVRISANPVTLEAGDETTITWLARDNTGIDHVELYLYRGAGTSAAFRVNTTSLVEGGSADGRLSATANSLPNNRRFVWEVPAGLPRGDDYRIRLVAVDEDGNSSERFTGFLSVASPDARLVSITSEPGSVIQGNDVTLVATVANSEQATAVQFVRDLDRSGDVSTGDSIIGNFPLDGDGRASVTESTTGLEPGQYTFVARLVLPGGEFGNRVLTKVTVTGVPNQPPQLGGVSISPSTVTKPNTVTITASGISDDRGVGSVIFVWDFNGDGEPDGGDAVLGRTSSISGGQASITIPSTQFDAGTQHVIVLVRDTDGRSSQWASTTVNVQNPAVPDPFISRLEPSATFQADAITLTVTALGVLNADEVRFYHDSNHNGQLDGSDTLLRIDDPSDGYFWRNSPQNEGFPLGVNRFFAQAGNSFGTLSNVVSTTVTNHALDTTVPTATLDHAPGVVEEVTSYEFVVRYTDNIAINVDDFSDLDVRVISGDGTWSADAEFVTSDEPVDGPVRFATYRIAARDGRFVPELNSRYDVRVQGVRDTNGNTIATGIIGSFDVAIPFEDLTPPTVLIDELSPDVSAPTPVRTDADSFSALAEDADSGIDPASYEFAVSRYDGTEWTPWLFTNADSTSLVVGEESDGLYRTYVTVRNRAGLTGISQTVYYLLDRELPQRPPNVSFLSDTGALDNDGLTRQSLPTFYWDAATDVVSEVAGYWYSVDNPTPSEGGAFTTETVAAVSLSGDGEHNFYVQALDAAGNVSAVNATRLTLDTAPPTVTGTTPTVSSTLGSGPLVIDVDFSEAMDQASLSAGNVELSGPGVGSASVNGVTWIDQNTARLSISGQWSDGAVAVSMNAGRPQDLAGNSLSPVEATSFTIESTTSPEIAVTTSGGANIEDGNFSVDLGSVELGGASPQSTFTISNSGTATLTITDVLLPDGFRVVTPPAGRAIA